MHAVIDTYWSHDQQVVNLLIIWHVAFAYVLGTLIGYERSYHGHAAGMRTYALVATASTVLVIVSAFPGHWYGGSAPSTGADPTRVIQGVVTGIGFLCAGVIIKEGFSIRGLSTSASIWMAAAIGVVAGLGFFLAAAVTTVLTMLAMGWFRGVEQRLPHQENVRLVLSFHADACPEEAAIVALAERYGFRVTETAYEIDRVTGRVGFNMLMQTASPARDGELVRHLKDFEGLAEARLAPSRS